MGRGSGTGLRRAWVLALGVAAGAAALYALATLRPAAGGEGHEEIDDASRARLEQVLREAREDGS